MKRTREIARRIAPPGDEKLWSADIHPVLRRVFAARGIGPAAIDHSLSSLLSVSKLEHTDEAADRLARARHDQERVLVLGDFDADGATATALVMTCLRAFGFAYTHFLVPDRQRFGYGLSAPLVEVAADYSPDIIVTVDNGISSHAGVEAANALGIDVLVTDHHLPGETLPDACVIVNPNAPDSDFESKGLAGVGVAFYVMAALGQRLAADHLLDSAAARGICADCLDLVALGTVADLVPLDHNNRILVAQGLARMRAGRCRPGIAALFDAAGRDIGDAATGDLGFAIAPRLNAAGRLTDMTVGINCLLAEDNATAAALASELSHLNRQRRQVQTAMQKDAEVHIDQLEEKLGGGVTDGLCLFDASWHQGVVGLVATRIRERINRPVIAFAPGDDVGSMGKGSMGKGSMLKGSGRSVQGVHMRDVLAGIDARHPALIDRYGGHAMAAGLSLASENLDRFREAFALEVARYADQIDEVDRLWSDGELDASDLNLGMAETLRHAAPWGQGCPEPSFDGRFEILEQRIVGEQHLKLKVRPAGGGQPVEGIAFNHPELLPQGDDSQVLLVYRLDVNEFRNVRNPQLVVDHIECV